MLKIYFLKGLPGSGKSTWAKQKIKDSPANSIKRVNKDDLRNMLDAGRWSRGNEAFVLNVQNSIIMSALSEGKHVIIDNTNFEEKHLQSVLGLVEQFKNIGCSIVVEEKFFDTPLKTCIERDSFRPNPVGAKVITSMYNKYIKKEEDIKYREPTGKKPCIICDIDGTLAKMDTRGPYEWHRVGEDRVVPHILELLENYKNGLSGDIILVSGRDGSCESETRDWLDEWDVPYDFLFMREAGDMRKDSIVKREIFEDNIEDVWDVQYVLDDRNQMVDMWRKELRIPCLQVDYGDF